MRSISLIFFVLAITCLAAKENKDASKYNILRKMMSGGVVTLNDDTYTEFMLNGDRDFDAFLLYTTTGNKYRCQMCPAANTEFSLVAQAYESQEEKADRNIVFFRIPIDNSPLVFKYHDFTAAPIITFLSQSEPMTKKLNANNDYQIDYPLRAESIASYARSKIHVNIEIKRFPWTQVIIACLFIFGLPLAAFIYLFKYELVYKILGSSKIYMTISLLIYGMAVTGFAFDLIHRPAFLSCRQDGCHLFASVQNQQTMAEGLLTGGLLIATSAATVFLIRYNGTSKENTQSVYNYLLLMGCCFTAYCLCFIIRTPWYPSVFFYRGFNVCLNNHYI